MKKYLLSGIIALILVCGFGFYWVRYIYPFQEFRRMGDIQFPAKSKSMGWEDNGLSVKGKFQIPIEQIGFFIEKNGLSAGLSNPENLTDDRCIHDGKNRVRIDFNQKSGIAQIEVFYPDYAGDNPCGKPCDKPCEM